MLRWTERIRRGERPEIGERSVEIPAQLEGVETMVEAVECVPLLGGEDARGAEALVRRLGAVIDAVDAGALASLGQEFLHGLEEVHVQAGEAADAGELRIGGPGGEAIIADELPDHRAVLLLDVGVVVLFPGAAVGEGDPLALTPGVERVVDELRAVVAVDLVAHCGSSTQGFYLCTLCAVDIATSWVEL